MSELWARPWLYWDCPWHVVCPRTTLKTKIYLRYSAQICQTHSGNAETDIHGTPRYTKSVDPWRKKKSFRSHRSFQNGKESLTHTVDQILQTLALTIEPVVIHLNWSNIVATAKSVVTSSQKELLIVGICWRKTQYLQSLWMVSSQN